MISAGSPIHVFSPRYGAYHASIEQKIHLTGCADLWDHLSVRTAQFKHRYERPFADAEFDGQKEMYVSSC